eukprot:CAMPEP_0202686932 /NCGR_PEP_ID=MMETSP1385-20130828/2681_1 /ASSEMBLY_ACC=CAM_ASM_000861 /TAXON_ID=933848 /ORGANISM="Elphidium margaritaceum" /LENGTH=786 /DNA_ID=CAMNT_0049341613 /DNA_START=58 /DNA_END=2418 /DNA_ORIENTATION=+
MPRKSGSSHMPYTELTRVSSTFNRSLRIIHSQTANKASKIVVADQSGCITCFKWVKDVQLIFEQNKNEAITALSVDNEQRIVIAHGQTIETIRKKGKVLSTFNASLNEDITSVECRHNTVWCCGEYLYNCYKSGKDAHFFMCNDIIHDMILIDLGLDEYCPVLACKDKTIRVIHGSQILFEVEATAGVTALHQIPCHEPNYDETHKQIVYGLSNGGLGQLILNATDIHSGWLLDDPDEGTVNCITSYDFTGDDLPEVIVGRDNGVLDVYEWRPAKKPFILASEALNESVTSVDTGYVTGVTPQDIIVATYSGKIRAFHCDASRDFSAWEEAETSHYGANRLASPLRAQLQHQKTDIDTMKAELQQEIDTYRSELASKKAKYQEVSKELIAVNTQFYLKPSLKLLHKEAAYLLCLEIGTPIDLVCIQCTIPMVSLDIDEQFGLQAQHHNMDEATADTDVSPSMRASSSTDRRASISNMRKQRRPSTQVQIDRQYSTESYDCFVFHASAENSSRFTWKFRVSEGQQGMLTAVISSKRVPKTSQICQFPIKALSLHSSVVFDVDEEVNALSAKRPVNTLTMSAQWSLRQFVPWLSQCIPDVPSRLPINGLSLAWYCSFIGDFIHIKFRNGVAEFSSDSVTNIAILKDFFTKIAIENNLTFSKVNVNVHLQSALHVFELIRSKLEYHHAIHEKHAWIYGLREIESHEEQIGGLSEKMQAILKESEQIIEAYQTSPKHLQFIKNVIFNQIRHFAKLRNQRLSFEQLEKLKYGLDHKDHCEDIVSVIQELMK